MKLIINLTLLIITISSYDMSMETLLTTDTMDPDEVIINIKGIFDNYTNKIKNTIKQVDKIILNNDEEVYVNNFNIEDVIISEQNFLEESKNIRETDLKNFREDEQNLEEKNIDSSTRYKILNSRYNIIQKEIERMKSDFISKNNTLNNIADNVKTIIKNGESINEREVKALNDLIRFTNDYITSKKL